jgi:hypothetical protein
MQGDLKKDGKNLKWPYLIFCKRTNAEFMNGIIVRVFRLKVYVWIS